MYAKQIEQRRLREYDGHADFRPQRRLEHGAPVIPELRVRVVDGVELESESAAADHVGRVFGHHFPDLDLRRGLLVRLVVDARQQAVATLLYLVRHVLELVGRERGTELLAHRLPPFAAREEYIVV